MMINEKRTDPNNRKEMKLNLPVRYHVHLHSMKVLTGKQISDTVTEALEFYFAARAAAASEAALESLTSDTTPRERPAGRC